MVNRPVGKMYVLKRGGRKEEVHVDKITSRIQKLCYELNMDFVDPVSITLKVVNGLYPGVTTTELDTLAAETAIMKSGVHPDYAILAARIAISNLHKETKKQFSEVMDMLYNAVDDETEEKSPLISEEHHAIIMKNADRLNSCIIYDRDFSFNYFSFKILEHSFLNKINGKVVERPQHMLMRVAVGIHGEDIDSAISTYNLLSERYYFHTEATLLAAATPKPQLCSSFLTMMPDDSIEGIFKCLAQCGALSKYGSGIGLNIHNIRARGTYIAGTNGESNGVVPMLRVFDAQAEFVRNLYTDTQSSIAVYVEPWHADIFEYLNLAKSTGKDELRARNLSYALWVPDLFMKRVVDNGVWSLMCPHKSPGLSDCYGEDFEKLYERYEAEGNFNRQVPAQDLWKAIVVSQVETGGPCMLYKDACNEKNNQKHLGTIKCAGFCTDVIAYTSPEQIVACPQAAVLLSMFVSSDRKTFDFMKLREVTKTVTKNLDKVLDASYYALPEEKMCSTELRAIGVGVQGLADTFILLRMPFDSEEASQLNKQIFETVYYSAMEASCELAEKNGTYSKYEGSPASEGVLHYHMWDSKPSDLWNWAELDEKIKKFGLRNSLLISVMPTPLLSQILGTSDSVEPYNSNVFTRTVSSERFQVVNELLLRDLTDQGIWDEVIKKKIIDAYGSVQNLPEIPDDLKAIYKTSWEMSQKVILNQAADRAPFVDQGQCLNIHIQKPTYGSVTSMHFYGWKKGLKSGMCSIRTRAVPKVVQETVQRSKVEEVEPVSEELEEMKKKQEEEEERNLAGLVCSLKNPENCEMCGA
ncbi:ribonucleoside-diphosphate reductase large subunit [Leptinotarsa decemlineata]|uniref:ribonucleoside-diphosphate reductase large subunit n=1 Tax=Leptinotarsa decemlineata TaxID=7539 RepID=UPI003D309A04